VFSVVLRKSVVVLAGVVLNLVCQFGRYIFRAGLDYNGGDILVTPTECAGKYIVYTRQSGHTLLLDTLCQASTYLCKASADLRALVIDVIVKFKQLSEI